MQYILWQVLTQKNRMVEVSFMLAGHTKFTPDRFFGLFKCQFHRATVDNAGYQMCHEGVVNRW